MRVKFSGKMGGREHANQGWKGCHLPLCCASASGTDSMSSAAASITTDAPDQPAPAAPLPLRAPESALLNISDAEASIPVILAAGNNYPAPAPSQRSPLAAPRPVARRRLFNPEDQFPQKSLNSRCLAAFSASETEQVVASPRWPPISIHPRPSSPLSPPSDQPKVVLKPLTGKGERGTLKSADPFSL